MEPMTVRAAIQIGKPEAQVFEAIVDPDIMKHYFISKGTARLEASTTVYWQFPEFPFDSPVRVQAVEPPRLVRFCWDASTGEQLTVTITLTPRPDGSTVVRVTETGMADDEAGREWLVANTEGWANFLACLKAWMEYGVNLRRGAFDFMVDDQTADEPA